MIRPKRQMYWQQAFDRVSESQSFTGGLEWPRVDVDV